MFKVRTKLRKSVLDPVVVKEYGESWVFLFSNWQECFKLYQM